MSSSTSQALLGVTHTNSANEFIRVTEGLDGAFTVITQNSIGISGFTFGSETPVQVKDALRQLQVAMQRANVDGAGGGTNSRFAPA